MGRNGEEDNVRIRLRVRLRQEYRTLLVFGHVQHRAVVAGLKENFGADVVVKESTVRQFPAQVSRFAQNVTELRAKRN